MSETVPQNGEPNTDTHDHTVALAPARHQRHDTTGVQVAARTTSWQLRLYKSVKRLLELAPAVSIVFISLVVGVSVLTELRNYRKPVMGTISVPESLETRGYTSHVMARKIGDAYRQVLFEARTTMKRVALSVPAHNQPLVASDDSNSVLCTRRQGRSVHQYFPATRDLG